MCGIVAVIGGMFKKEVATFHDLLVVDSLRGPHSTGVYVVRGANGHLISCQMCVLGTIGGPLLAT